MFANRYTVLVDACSLVGVWQRNILLSLAEAELFRLRWSEKILNETEAALVKIFIKRGIADDRAVKQAAAAVDAMRRAYPDASVEDYSSFLEVSKALPDKGDYHVLAAALKTRASMLVTENLKDFPMSIVEPMNIEVKTADDFIADAVGLDLALAIGALSKMRARFKKPELTADEMLTKMESVGLTVSASTLRPYRSFL